MSEACLGSGECHCYHCNEVRADERARIVAFIWHQRDLMPPWWKEVRKRLENLANDIAGGRT